MLSEIIIGGVFLLTYTALLFFGGAYVYYRGASKSSPLPPAIDRIVNPQAKAPESPKPIPPTYNCPHCNKPTAWKLSPDERRWSCANKPCPGFVPGPKHQIGV